MQEVTGSSPVSPTTPRNLEGFAMVGIERKSFDSPDDEIKLPHGRMRVVLVADESVWRSELGPGWTWDDDMKPLAGGAASCPLTHREYVVSGRIRYHSDDGTEVTGE